MTEDRMALVELLQKSGDGDFLRAVAETVLQILMEADVEGLIGAGRHERTGDRLNYRNGYRDRSLDTRLGPLSLRIPKDGEWPYLWLDATYLKVRDGGRLVSVAAIIAMAVSTEGRREIVGLGIGPSEAEPFWSGFIKGLTKRGLRGIKLVISDAHDGLRHAITRVLGATWQRCRVHWIRNALAHVAKGQHTMVAAAIRQAFPQADAEAAHQTWRHVADQLRPRWPKLAALMDDSEHDVLAYMTFPARYRTKVHSTNSLERLNKMGYPGRQAPGRPIVTAA